MQWYTHSYNFLHYDHGTWRIIIIITPWIMSSSCVWICWSASSGDAVIATFVSAHSGAIIGHHHLRHHIHHLRYHVHHLCHHIHQVTRLSSPSSAVQAKWGAVEAAKRKRGSHPVQLFSSKFIHHSSRMDNAQVLLCLPGKLSLRNVYDDHDDGSDGAADNTEAAEDYKAVFFLRDFPRCGGVAVRIASRFMAAMMLLRARSMLKPPSHQRCPFLWSYHRVIEWETFLFLPWTAFNLKSMAGCHQQCMFLQSYVFCCLLLLNVFHCWSRICFWFCDNGDVLDRCSCLTTVEQSQESWRAR